MTRGRLKYWIRQELFGPAVQRLSGVLHLLAFVWRRMLFRTTFVAITGSLGKTTTKECLALVLESVGRTYRTYRNQNGPSMVALNILRVRPWHRYAVLEVAGAAPGMMARSAHLLRPDVAIVLNVLRTHTTAFPGVEQLAEEKALLIGATKRSGVAVLNRDDPLVASMARHTDARVCFFGTTSAADCWADQVSATWPSRLEFVFHRGAASHLIETQLVGTQWLAAAVAVVATADALGVSVSDTARILRVAEAFPGRLQPVRVPSGAIILRDDYNGSVDTIEPSLRVLQEASAHRRLLVVTDVSDFGRNRKQRLKYLGSRCPQVADVAVFIGDLAEYGRRRAIEAGMPAENVQAFSSIQPAAEYLRRELKPGDLMLLKGRTTDHAARIFYAQLGPVGCWKDYCAKTMLCDICWELQITPEQARQAVVVPRPSGGGQAEDSRDQFGVR